jgi:uncharacterized membrane protein YgcG
VIFLIVKIIILKSIIMLPLLYCNGNNIIFSNQKTNLLSQKKIYKDKTSNKLTMISIKNKISNNSLKGFAGSLILLTPLLVNALPEVKPENPIIDDSGVLTKSSVSFLEKNSQKVLEVSGSKLYIVSIRTLPYGEDPSEFTKNLFSKWELKNNEVLVVLVSKIAKGSVYAGSDVKGLNDAVIKSIGEETFSFKAKEEQYSSAAIDVSNRLVSILTNKGDPGPPTLNRTNDSSNFKSAKVTEERRSKYVAIIIILLVIAFVVPMVQFFYYVKDE